MKNALLNYDDVTIVPEIYTTISNRSDCDPFDENDMLPIFTAPMSSVVDTSNFELFRHNGIYTVIPRSVNKLKRTVMLYDQANYGLYKHVFISISKSEAEDWLNSDWTTHKENKIYICIDIANGHMLSYINLCSRIKERYGDSVVLMAGNIANPQTLELYEKAKIDYVRCSIGTGSGCTTSSNTGVHYPIFSLIKEMYEMKKNGNYQIKLIADGGIKHYRDIQKALIYADYVMIGGLFNKCIESSAIGRYGVFYWKIFGHKVINPFKTIRYTGRKVSAYNYDKALRWIKNGNVSITKKFYGMSTKIAQKEISINNASAYLNKTSEGKVTTNIVEYSIKGWVDNEISYLRSAMSYTNSRDLSEYKESKWVKINAIKYNN